METKENLSSMEKALLGDFYTNHFDELWRLAYKILKDEEPCYDVVQSAFVDTIQSFHNIETPNEKVLRSYLYVAVQRKALNYIKHRDLHTIVEYEDYIVSKGLLPEEFIDIECEHSELRQCIKQLKEPYKSYVQMKFYYSWDNKMIAEVMNKKEGSIRMIHKRAMDKLEDMLTKIEQGEKL